MNANGSGRRNLTEHALEFGRKIPAYSPDGQLIAFSANRGGNSERLRHDQRREPSEERQQPSGRGRIPPLVAQ